MRSEQIYKKKVADIFNQKNEKFDQIFTELLKIEEVHKKNGDRFENMHDKITTSVKKLEADLEVSSQ